MYLKINTYIHLIKYMYDSTKRTWRITVNTQTWLMYLCNQLLSVNEMLLNGRWATPSNIVVDTRPQPFERIIDTALKSEEYYLVK